MTKTKPKSKLKSSAAAFKPVAEVVAQPAAVVEDQEEETELVESADQRGPKRVEEPSLGARAPPVKWLSLVHTAQYLDRSVMTVKRYIHDPAYAHLAFPRPSVAGGSYHFNVDELDAWSRSLVGAVSTRMMKKTKAAR